MNPEDVVIPELLTEGTVEEFRARARQMCQLLRDLDPYITALAIAFHEATEEDKPAALEAFLALDAKRMEVDDVFSVQLAIMRELNIPRGDC